MKDTVFISDLHLLPQRPEVIDLFIRFTREIAASADTLYILGDFLEVWWGDDDPAIEYQPVFDALAELATKHDTEIFLMHGNRDFMIGEALAEQCHFKIIDDPYKITLQGQECLLMHGDTLCIDDVEYQKFRQMVRNPQWQQQVLTKSLEERFQLAKSIREKSQQSTIGKGEVIIDINQGETDKTFIDNDVSLIIHGHTHRPAIHDRTVNGQKTTRIVLGDWHDSCVYLRVNDSSAFELKTYQ